MPLPIGLKNEIETTAAALASDLVAIQAAELTAGDGTGRYWQGMANPSSLPADGNAVALEPTRKPSDRGRTWADVGMTQIGGASTAKAQWQIHESSEPAYWIVAMLVVTPNETWRYVLACVGTPTEPEGWRNA